MRGAFSERGLDPLFNTDLCKGRGVFAAYPYPDETIWGSPCHTSSPHRGIECLRLLLYVFTSREAAMRLVFRGIWSDLFLASVGEIDFGFSVAPAECDASTRGTCLHRRC